VEEAGQTHVEDFDHTLAIDEQIAGFDVAVDNAGFMSVLQAKGGLADVVCGPFRAQRAVAANEVVQVIAVNEFEHDEVELVIVIDIMSTNDIGMIEASDGSSFTIEASQGCGVFSLLNRENFECDLAAHLDVFAEINGAHAASAQSFEKTIFAVDQKPAPFPGDQLLGLEMGEDPLFDEGIREFFGGLGSGP
jgi:hypothetical protein